MFFIFFLSEYIKHFISIYSNDKINCGNIENDFQGCLKFPKNNVIAKIILKILKKHEHSWKFLQSARQQQKQQQKIT